MVCFGFRPNQECSIDSNRRGFNPKNSSQKMRIFKIGGIGEKSALCITILIDNLIYPIIFKTVQQSVNILYVHFKKMLIVLP